MARAIGANLFHMEHVQVHPTGLVDPSDPTAAHKLLGPEALRGLGGLLLNRKGERFVNEVGLRKDVSAAILAQGDEFMPFPGDADDWTRPTDAELPLTAYLLLNADVVKRFGTGPVGFYQKRGMIKTANTYNELGKLLNVDPDVLRKPLENVNMFKGLQGIEQFGRPLETHVFWGEHRTFYVAMVTPVIHYTMGGLDTTFDGKVTLASHTHSDSTHQNDRDAFKNLYAAGEVSSGVHGDNRLAGNSLLECVVFGRHVGKAAMRDFEDQQHTNEFTHDEL
jgi:succinate dehydrogenase/fumarate reductase flavoprotein subunit